MAVILHDSYTVEEDIENHPAWLGRISGLKAEKILRGKKTPYLYVLRAGEAEGDYYISFILPDFSIKHQPFVITHTSEGWYFENCNVEGPFIKASINQALNLIMHCHQEKCTPFIVKNE